MFGDETESGSEGSLLYQGFRGGLDPSPLYLWYYAIVASIYLGLRVLGQAASPLWSLVLTASTVTAMYH